MPYPLPTHPPHLFIQWHQIFCLLIKCVGCDLDLNMVFSSWHGETDLSPPVKYFYWPFQGGTSFVDHLCLVFFMLLCLFIAALSSPAGKGLTSWLLLVMFIVFLLLSHVVSWVRCGTSLYHFLIFAGFLTLKKVSRWQSQKNHEKHPSMQKSYEHVKFWKCLLQILGRILRLKPSLIINP